MYALQGVAKILPHSMAAQHTIYNNFLILIFYLPIGILFIEWPNPKILLYCVQRKKVYKKKENGLLLFKLYNLPSQFCDDFLFFSGYFYLGQAEDVRCLLL